MPITKKDARKIAQDFLDSSHRLGQYRFTNWDKLTSAQRQKIENFEWDLLNYSSNFITTAVGIALNDMDADLKAITDATNEARAAIEKIDNAKEVINITADLVALGGAITSKNPSAIGSAAKDLFKTAKNIVKKTKAAKKKG